MTNEARKQDTQVEPVTLRVAEGLGKDVGRSIARLDPKDLARLDAEVGDILAITGERRTVAKAMPAYSDTRGKGLLQIDGITRGNAKTGLDQRVKVTKIDHVHAARIVMRPVGGTPTLKRDGDTRYVGRLLEGLPLVVGDRVRATLFGSRFQDFEVVGTYPKDSCVVIHPQTQIVIETAVDKGAKSAKDNGRGMSKEDIPKAFEIFRRVGKQDAPGEGMGLAYVKTLIRLLGGRIWCESEPGVGTTFSFSLPLSAGQPGERLHQGGKP